MPPSTEVVESQVEN